MDGLHTNHAGICLFQIDQGTAAIGDKVCLLMAIKLASKNNEVWNAGVILTEFLPWFEVSESLVFIGALEF